MIRTYTGSIRWRSICGLVTLSGCEGALATFNEVPFEDEVSSAGWVA